VFFIELKLGVTIRSQSARAAADKQIRDRITDFIDKSPAEIHGVSALGPKLCFYCYDKDKETYSPELIIPDPHTLTDTAPADRWETDITTDDGFDTFMALVAHVKTLSVTERV
jgi:hypothetical protein